MQKYGEAPRRVKIFDFIYKKYEKKVDKSNQVMYNNPKDIYICAYISIIKYLKGKAHESV